MSNTIDIDSLLIQQNITSRIRHLKAVRINTENNQHYFDCTDFSPASRPQYLSVVNHVNNRVIMINYYSFLITRCLLFIIIQISDSSLNILNLIQSFMPIDNGLVKSSCRADNGIIMFDTAFVIHCTGVYRGRTGKHAVGFVIFDVIS